MMYSNICLKTNSVKFYTLIFTFFFLLSNFTLNCQVSSLYTFSTSAGTYTAITGGTQSHNSSFDDAIVNVTIPSFNFNGSNYTAINISSNGFITFGATAPSSSGSTTGYTPISATTGYSGAISAFGYDLNYAGAGSPEVRYQTVGSEFIVQWQDARRYNVTSERISFQIRLNTSTNSISVVYGGTITPMSGTSLQVGLRGAANTDFNNRTISSGDWSGTTAGTLNTSSCVFNSTGSNKPTAGRTFTWDKIGATTLYDTPFTAGTMIAFNNAVLNTSTPIFTLSSNATSDRFLIELNTKPDFTGTSYTQTFTGSYTASTKYDLTCNSLSTSLPTSVASYFVRAKSSSDGGSTWGAYTSVTWVFSRSTSTIGFHYTTSSQFDAGTLVSTNYGNFIVSNNNGTTSVADDDYMVVNQGTNTSTLTANDDHYLTEGTSNFGGGSYDYLTLGSYYSGSQKTDYVGFRFQNYVLPQGCTVQSAYLNAYVSDTGVEPAPNVTNNLYLKVRAVAADNCSAWANSTNVTTGDPKNRTRSASSLDWDVSTAWTDLQLITSPDISTVLQDVMSRAGYVSGNSIGLILDYDGAAVTSANRHRYFSTPYRSSAYKAYLTTTFTNFTNNVQFTNIALGNIAGASAWDELTFDVDKASCGACDVTFEVRKTSDNSLIASGNTSPISLAGNTTPNVYVVAIMKRNSSPLLHSFTLTTNSIVVLPIDLISFSGKKERKENVLKWETFSEINNDFFTIEKSTDGKDFEVVGIENGAGNSNHYLNYTLVDPDVKKTINYYRLKQTDFNGKFTFSQLISIDNREGENEKFIVRIINLLGQEVNENYKGVVIIQYSDNSCLKFIQN